MDYKTIKGFPNYMINIWGQIVTIRGKAIKWGTNGMYPKVILYNKGYRKDKYVHRLVAEHWIPNPENKEQVNHIDGDRLNNCKSNLEWVTPSENQKHSYAIGLNSRAGANNGQSKLTEKNVKWIRRNYKRFTKPYMAQMFGVCESTVRSAGLNKTWIHVKI